MNKNPIVVADADAIIAQVFPGDSHYEKALQILESLETKKTQIIYPSTAIAEAVTYIQRVLSNSKLTYNTASLFTDPSANIVEVNLRNLQHAQSYFSPTTSKKNTFFDCIVAAIADEYNADAIFSFDKFYTKKGFKLAEEL